MDDECGGDDVCEDGKMNEGKMNDVVSEDVVKVMMSGFGSVFVNVGFGGFGGLKSAAASGGGFGGFVVVSVSVGMGGFVLKVVMLVFGGVVVVFVVLFGVGKKKEMTTEEDEEGDDDLEREVANDFIKLVVELEVIEMKIGEEGEMCVFCIEGVLFEYVNDVENGLRWVERGRGDVRFNEGENGF